MAPFAGADLTSPFWISEVLYPFDRTLTHPGFRNRDDPNAFREPIPQTVWIAQVGGNIGFEDWGRDRREEAFIGVLLQPRDIDGENNVGGATRALCNQSLDQPFRGKDDIDLGAGLFFEILKKGIEQKGLSM